MRMMKTREVSVVQTIFHEDRSDCVNYHTFKLSHVQALKTFLFIVSELKQVFTGK